MNIIEYILYNGEPIIEFRLKYLNKYVDKFIIVESIYTHSGKRKDDLYYNLNKDIFQEYEIKFLFHPIYNLPTKEDTLNIRKNNILYEDKDSWIFEYIHVIIYKKN
jgi:beta-1,4-mannosyl-glycoprotein beta-1,4-N-acetylglucosaminyltransferase